MSTKNMARTIVEGGRATGWEARCETRAERRRAHILTHAAKFDAEVFEETPAPRRRSIRPEFRDRLGPLYRWIFKQQGRLWDDCYAEMASKFDARTTKGRHLLRDHLTMDDYGFSFQGGSLCLTQGGTLVFEPGIRPWQRRFRRERLRYFSDAELMTWLDGRRIISYGETSFWLRPMHPRWKGCGLCHDSYSPWIPRKLNYDGTVRQYVSHYVPRAWCQDVALNWHDRSVLASLNPAERLAVLYREPPR